MVLSAQCTYQCTGHLFDSLLPCNFGVPSYKDLPYDTRSVLSEYGTLLLKGLFLMFVEQFASDTSGTEPYKNWDDGEKCREKTDGQRDV